MWEYKQNGSQEARSQLVLYYSYIAKSLAAKMTSTYQKYATTEEMVNQRIIALIDSLDRFDPSKGVKFSTYAFTKVRGAIIDYVRKQDWLSRRVRQMDIRISKAEDELTNQLGRPPTRRELAGHLNLPIKELDQYIYERSGESFYSLEALMSAPTPQHSLSAQEDVFDPESRLDEQELRQARLERKLAYKEQLKEQKAQAGKRQKEEQQMLMKAIRESGKSMEELLQAIQG